MKIYTVHEMGDGLGQADKHGGTMERADELLFIRDGFAILAVISPVVWFIWHKLWIPLVVYIVVLLVLMGAGQLAGFGETQMGILSTLVNLAVGLEANNIRRWIVERRGMRTIGVVSGENLEECEYRFFSSWLDQPVVEKSLVARLETA